MFSRLRPIEHSYHLKAFPKSRTNKHVDDRRLLFRDTHGDISTFQSVEDSLQEVDSNFTVFRSLESNNYFEYVIRLNLTGDPNLAMMLADQSKIPQATVVMVMAMVASLAAALTAGQVGGEQTKMITAFPKA